MNVTALNDEQGAKVPATVDPLYELDSKQLVGLLRHFLQRITTLEARIQEQDKFLLTFRQSQLIMLGASEEALHLERSVKPKHRRKTE